MAFYQNKSGWLQLFFVTTGVLVSAAFLCLLPPLQDLENKIQDQYFMIRGPLDVTDSPIVIVEVSQEADEEIPFRYPWPRQVYAKLIENLNRAGARVIAIDLLFDQEDENPANDAAFAEALAEYSNVVLIGGFRRSTDTFSEKTTRVMPARILENAMKNPPGIVDMRRDSDGFIREYPFGANFAGEQLYSFALQTLITAEKADTTTIEINSRSFQFSGHSVPKNRNGFMNINYYGGNRTFEHIGFEKIVDDGDFDTRMEMQAFPINEFSDPEYGLLASGVLENKIVLVGATMPELQDYHPVPFAASGGETIMSGVEIHANALQTILDENFLYDLPRAVAWPVSFLLLFFLAYAVNRLKIIQGVAVTFLILAVTAGAGYILFTQFSMMADILPVLLASVGIFITITTQNYLSEQKEKQRITSMFSSYVSPDLVNRLIEGEEDFKLAGESKHLTVLFSDIANFSKLSEKMPAEKVVAFMNEYLGSMTSIITNEDGTLDKYIGDAVMAFFGAPLSLPEHAVHACRSALLMQKASEELKKSVIFDEDTIQNISFHTRIGINTGAMVVGNMGSGQRFNYTVMGDNVNLGARCEAACKEFGIPIMVTGATKKEADNGEFLFRYLGKLRVIGKQQPVDIYQPVTFKEQSDSEVEEVIQTFEQAVNLYLAGDWKTAARLFEETREKEALINPVSKKKVNPSAFYLNLCRIYIKTPPVEQWDGVIEQSVK
ncbi:MAG: adenylate/guanylate cyclase domain-containing protein [Balneolaceae bacterium]